MKNLAMIFILTFAISCNTQNSDNGTIVKPIPYLVGTWSGEGRLLDVNLDKQIGLVKIELEIKEDFTVLGKIGAANLIKTSITEAKYGFDISGELDAELKKGSNLNKDHVIILLVLPEDNRQNVIKSDANFHLKSNYIFDFSMRVGGVTLSKEQ